MGAAPRDGDVPDDPTLRAEPERGGPVLQTLGRVAEPDGKRRDGQRSSRSVLRSVRVTARVPAQATKRQAGELPPATAQPAAFTDVHDLRREVVGVAGWRRPLEVREEVDPSVLMEGVPPDARGNVFFQATGRHGTGVYEAGDSELRVHCERGPGEPILSHPAALPTGEAVFYTAQGDSTAVVAAIDGVEHVLLHAGQFPGRIGPLGPTADAHGRVAVRGWGTDGRARIWQIDGGRVHEVACTGKRFGEFFGLPLAIDDGAVLFRAQRVDGVHGLYRWSGGEVRREVETGSEFSSIGLFPCAGGGEVVFVAMGPEGSGVWRLTDTARAPFVDGGGRVVVFATPPGRTLGLYAGPDPTTDRLLAVGDAFDGSTVEAFALNPVSVNAAGRLAVRLKLADGRGLIIVR